MRRRFSKSEKIAAVERLERGEPVDHPKMVRRWRDELHKFGANAFTGYGNARVQGPKKTEAVVFRLTPNEYERFLARVQSSGARSLSDFARRQVFAAEPDPRRIARRIADLITVVKQLARTIPDPTR